MAMPLTLMLSAALVAPMPGDVVVRGHVRACQDRLFENRIFSDFARKEIWGEAREAFVHPDDDVFQAPIGMRKGEYWGKLMISACRVAAHTHSEELRRFLHEEALRLMPLLRTTPAATVERGPLILAKSAKFGEDAAGVLATCGINEGGWKVTAEPLADAPSWGAWRLGFERGGERRSVNACDYSSAAAWTMDKIEFSIFF